MLMVRSELDDAPRLPGALHGVWLPERAQQVLVVLLELASATEESASAAEIAHATGVPLRRVDVLMGDLRRLGLVASRLGRGGGYRLARPATHITVGEILQNVEWSVISPGAQHQASLSKLQARLAAAVAELKLADLLA
jgi:Rrf2 family protein